MQQEIQTWSANPGVPQVSPSCRWRLMSSLDGRSTGQISEQTVFFRKVKAILPVTHAVPEPSPPLFSVPLKLDSLWLFWPTGYSRRRLCVIWYWLSLALSFCDMHLVTQPLHCEEAQATWGYKGVEANSPRSGLRLLPAASDVEQRQSIHSRCVLSEFLIHRIHKHNRGCFRH